MITVEESTMSVEDVFRDVFDLARQVAAADTPWRLYEIACHCLRDNSGEIAPSYQVLSCVAGVIRHIAARCGDTPGDEVPSPKLAEQVINEAVRGVNDSLMRRVISHRTAQLQRQACALADPRIPVVLIPKLAEQFCEHTAGGEIDRLEAIEAGVHLVAWLASMSGDAIATLNAAEAEILAPRKPQPQQEEITT
jgi:hypothetical protein